MRIEFVRLSRWNKSPVLKVWNRHIGEFETHNGNKQWESWDAFVSDLKVTLAERARCEDRDGDDLLREYEGAATIDVRRFGQPVRPSSSKIRDFLYNLKVWAVIAFVLLILFHSLWEYVAHPFLGWLGVVEYKSKIDKRYERFLSEVAPCSEDKKVFTEKSAKLPVLHIYTCPNGEQKVWAYKIEKATQVDDGKWVLD